MKQAILNLKKKLLLVEVAGEISKEFLAIMNEHGMAEILGKLTDITEKQFNEWVEQYMVDKWRNYLTEIQYMEYLKSTAKESFFSYLEAQGIYFENPLGEKPILNEDNLWGNTEQDTQVFAALNYQIDKWQEAEEKVWKLENLFLFEIL